jgi:serine/threonine-protein kinase RsbW
MMATNRWFEPFDRPRQQPTKGWSRHSVSALGDLPALLDRVVADVRAAGADSRDETTVTVALTEAVINSLRHGHGGDPAKAVRVCYHITRGHWLAEVVDQGKGFFPQRCLSRSGPQADPGTGRGIPLMTRCLSWLRYTRGGTRVTLCKRLGETPQATS